MIVILFILLLAAPAWGATSLSTAAGALKPGQWGTLTTTGISSGGVNIFSTPSPGGHIFEFSAKGTWDTGTECLYYRGTAHHGTVREKQVRYCEGTNTWTVLTEVAAAAPNSGGNPDLVPITFHGYDHQVVRNGKYYHRPYNGFLIRVWDIGTQTWESNLTSLSGIMGGLRQCCGSLEYFPDFGTFGSLIFMDGDWGTFRYAFSGTGTAGTWSKIISGNGGPNPRILMGAHSNVSGYSPKKQLIVFGGGTSGAGGSTQNRNAYKMDSAGTVTQLTDFPCNISDNDAGAQGFLIPDPITGNFLVMCHPTGPMYMLDPVNDVYTNLNVTLPFTWTTDNNLMFVPLHDYNVIMFIVWQSQSTASVHLFKPNTDFTERCNAAGVIRCVDFDSLADISPSNCMATNNCWSVHPYGVITGAATVSIDTSLQASGDGALKFSMTPGQSGNANFFVNFADDYGTQFGAGEEFYLSFRQYMSTGFTAMATSEFKQMNLGTGSTASGSPNSYGSCTDLEIVMQSIQNRGMMQAYSSCPGSDPLGNLNYDEPFSSTFKLQNARATPFCLHSQTPAGGGASDGSSLYPPTGNCWEYDEGAWMAFKVKVTIGTRSGSYWQGSNVKIWAAHDGQAWELIHDWTYGSSTSRQHFGGTPTENQKYGQVWLLPRNVGGWSTSVHTLYDELIISTQDIAAPGIGGSTPSIPPSTPTVPSNLVVKQGA